MWAWILLGSCLIKWAQSLPDSSTWVIISSHWDIKVMTSSGSFRNLKVEFFIGCTGCSLLEVVWSWYKLYLLASLSIGWDLPPYLSLSSTSSGVLFFLSFGARLAISTNTILQTGNTSHGQRSMGDGALRICPGSVLH